jgi:hypothetical protein
MTENPTAMHFRDRIRWWIYEKCFAYCVRMVDPDANPDEFCLLDRTGFVALSRDEAQEIIEEAPDQAWRLESLLVHG